LVGLLLSAVFDMPTGAVIVWTVAALASAPLLAHWREPAAAERSASHRRQQARKTG